MSILILLLIANGAPVITRMILRDRFVVAVDGGMNFFDGKAIFGPRKTLIGLAASGFATTLAALLLGIAWPMGLLVAVGAMAGDLLSSFIKRRMAVAPHGVVLGLDQLPEALLPLLLVKAEFELDGVSIIAIVAAFCVTEWVLSYVIDRFDLLHTKKAKIS